MPGPYTTTLRTSHSDNVQEPIASADINTMAGAVNTLGNDANLGGSLDLPSHKAGTDHDTRYPLRSDADPYAQYYNTTRGDARYGLGTAGSYNHPTIADFENFTDQGADPASPAAGIHRIFSKAGGIYIKDSTGAVIGPLSAGAAANAPFQYAPMFAGPQSGDTAKQRFSVATTITGFGAQRTGGTGATVDVLKNGISILTAPISLAGTGWTTGVLVASPNFAAGDICSIVLSGVAGSPTDIITSLDGSRVTF